MCEKFERTAVRQLGNKQKRKKKKKVANIVGILLYIGMKKLHDVSRD